MCSSNLVLLFVYFASVSTVWSIFVDPPFLFVDEDWPTEKPLPVVICSRGTSDVRIISGNEQGYFSIVPINNTCATLQLNKPLDADLEHAEGQRWQSFSFVFEGRRHSRMSLEIQVVDVNDNAPEFVDTVARLSLPETTPVDTLVTKVKTFDPDTGIGGIVQFFVENSKFSIVNGQCSRAYCTAEIYLKSPLNYDSVRTEVVTVIARDGASRSKSSKESRFNITINVVDEQNTAPFFVTDLSREFTVKVDSSIGERLFQIEAEDGDRFHADKNPISYSLEKNTYFEITPSSGWIVLSKSLQGRNTDLFKLTVTATETDSKHMSAQGTLKIRIVDMDKHPPKCEKSLYLLEFNAETGNAVSEETIKVFDEDTNENFNKFNVELKGRHAKDFEITPKKVNGRGELSLRLLDGKSLADSEKLELRLKVANKTQPDGRCDISVRLKRPTSAMLASIPSLLIFNVSENSVPAVIGDLRSHVPGSSEMKFSLLSQKLEEIFEVDSDGILITLRALDREEVDSYSLVVKVEGKTGGSANMNVDVRVLDENDNAPVFTMEKRAFVIVEEAPATIQVQAIDQDFIENGTISYAITSSTCPQCSINSKTGIISVEPIDADSLSNLTIPVTVTATDLGTPAQSNTTEIVLFVEDINDHYPKFKQLAYTFTLDGSLDVGGEIGQVEAEDEDVTGNEVAYTTNDDYFDVDTSSGEVTLRKRLPSSVKSHEFEMNATDSGLPPKSTVVVVNVLNAGYAKTVPHVERIVSVGKQNLGQIVYTPDTNGDTYQFNVLTDHRNQGLLSINKQNGSITLRKLTVKENFDADIEVRELSGTVIRKEHLIFNVTKPQAPSFPQSLYSTTIRENSPSGYTVLTVKATGDNLQYTISTDPPGVFEISEFGDVLLVKNVDYEITSVINGTITVENSEGETASTRIQVDVLDENDNSPICKENHSITVSQTIAVGTVLDLPIPLCEDEDSSEQGMISYSRAGNNDYFQINESSSAITVSKLLPATTITFLVNVIDNPGGNRSHEIQIPVTVHVMAENLHAPKFDPFQSVTVSQNTARGATLYQFTAQDDDGDNIVFSIDSSNQTFHLEPNGKLKLIAESQLLPGKLCFAVTATDSGSPSKSTRKDFCVTVVDNRTAKLEPVVLWPAPNSVHKFVENKKFDHLLMINATVSPVFSGADRSLRYGLVEQPGEARNGFSIDSEGHLTNNVPFNYEDKQKYEVRVEICDAENRCTQMNVIIQVIDANDNCPFFQQQSSLFEIEENVAVSEAGLVVGEFPAAVDLDASPEQRSICYSLLTTYSFFLPNKTLPILYLNQSLDREIVDQIQLTVRVHDCNHGSGDACVDPNLNPSRADHIIIVNVLDKNDNFPRFDKRTYQFGAIVGQVRPGEKIASLVAQDPDLETDGLRYSLNGAVRSNNVVMDESPFEVADSTGQILTSMTFNGDLARSYTFHMGVSDGANHTDEAIVTISILTYSHQAELLLNIDSVTAELEKDKIIGLVANASSMQVVLDSIKTKQDITHVLVHFLDRENNLANVLDALTTMNTSWSETAVNARHRLKTEFGLSDIRILPTVRLNLAMLRSMIPLAFGALAALLVAMLVIIAFCCRRQKSAKHNLPRRIPSMSATYYNAKKTVAPMPRRESQRSNAEPRAAWKQESPKPNRAVVDEVAYPRQLIDNLQSTEL